VDKATSEGFNPPNANSEMAHFDYTELGNIGYLNSGWGLSNTGDFKNIVSDMYWSGTQSAVKPGFAWYFSTNSGGQSSYGYVYEYGSCLAVRPGQLESVAVPEPSTFLLLGAGFVVWPSGGSVKGRGDPVGRPYGNYKHSKDLRGF
jgi:hypothetical protein